MTSLKRLLFLRYALAVTVVVAVVAVVIVFPLRSQMLGEKKEQLEIEAVNTAALMKPYFTENKSYEIPQLLSQVDFSDEERLTVIDVGGVVLGDSWADPATMDNHANRPTVREALRGKVTVSVRYSSTVDRDLMYAAAPVTVDGNIVGVVRIAVEQGSLAPIITSAWLVMVGGLLFLLLVLFATTFWIQRKITADLDEIGRGLEKMVVDNDLDRMPQPQLEELQKLAGDLDTVAERARENYNLLENERDRLRVILENINAGIIVLDGQRRIALMNPSAERMLGLDEPGSPGKTLAEVHPAVEIDEAVRVSAEGREVATEIAITTPERRILKVVARPITGESGVTTGVVCVFDDVTSTRRLERMRQDFVANVSHELRTPVASFRATLDALLGGAMSDPDASSRFLGNLDTEADRLMGLISDLLTLSRLESEELSVAVDSIDLGELLSALLADKERLAERHGVEMGIEPGGEDLLTTGDRKLLVTAFNNLLDNAIKYNREGGYVTVALREDRDRVTVSISDTGIGIPRQDLDKVFERFYRVDRARSRETGGTGLGLSIVKHVLDLHGGSVTVESYEGYGSTFEVTLRPA
jgi:two-component system, OmpR family, phosphate regulon sensor histidine kinase PhoR